MTVRVVFPSSPIVSLTHPTKAIFIDIDNTLLDFDAYVKESLRSGFEKFEICTYEDWMHDAFERENRKLWLQIEDGSLSFE